MRIAIIADTHLPKGARRLPRGCIERLREADLIVHGGDFTRLEVLKELQSYSQVIAVHGNVDDSEVRSALPESTEAQFEGIRIALIHDAGPARGRAERLRRRFPDADAVVFGHSHIPLHEFGPDGFQVFNPGSPTECRRAPHHTMGIAEVANGALTFELIELD